MASAADSAGIPVTTLRQWVDSGRLPARVGKRGRLVRLADVQHLVAGDGAFLPNGAAMPAGAQTSASRNDNGAAGAPGHGSAAPGRIRAAAPSDDDTVDVVADRSTAAVDGTVEPAANQQRLAIVRNAAAFISKLDQLYRAQIAAKDGEIAAKEELIVELRRRAVRAEQHATRLEQKLAELRAHAEVVETLETQPVPPASHPGLLRRIMSWYRRL